MILVTGASGFIGSHLYRAMAKRYGADNVVALTTQPQKGRYLLHNNYAFSPDFFLNNGVSPDVIVHVGAYIPKTSSENNDWQNCTKNITSTQTLLSANFPRLKKFIFISTVDVYQNTGEIISERSVVSPVSMYGHSKLYCEKMVEAWAATNAVPMANLRLGHVYGPGEDKYHKLIPVAMRAIIDGSRPRLFGTGEELRSFVYIEDVTDAILNVLEDNTVTGTVNVVGDTPVTVKALMEKIVEVAGGGAVIEKIAVDWAGRNLVYDSTAMNAILKRPQTDLATGLRLEWEYMKTLD